MKAHSGKLCGKIRGSDLSGTIGGLAGFRRKRKKLRVEERDKM